MIQNEPFQKIDNRPIPETVEEVRAFMCIRNELLRLPWVLEYHRRIGVGRFIVVDNGSTDGSTEYLLSQNDVHCFYTTESFSQSDSGMTWKNFILNSFGIRNWCLVIDADEMFIYPQYEKKPLHLFIEKLEALGFQAAVALVLDMYSKIPIKDAVYKSGEPFLATCPYFDSGLYKIFKVPFSPPIQIYGGPRERIFWKNSDVDFHSPTMSVIPLIKWQADYEFIRGRHCINTPLKFSFFCSAILHFKFFHDFYERAEIEVKREEHFEEAREYKMYLQYLKDNPNFSFYYGDSVLYKDSTQLINLNLMKSLDNC